MSDEHRFITADEYSFSEWAPVLDALHAFEIIRHLADAGIIALNLAPDPVTAAAHLDHHMSGMASFLSTLLRPGRPLRIAITMMEQNIGIAAQATTRGAALHKLGDILRNNASLRDEKDDK